MFEEKDKNRETESLESSTDKEASKPIGRREFLAGLGIAGTALAVGELWRGTAVHAAAFVPESSINGEAHREEADARGAQGEGWIDVRQFGAKGDGTKDDTVAIQRALQAANGRNVWFPTGTYRITGTLTVPLVRLIGEGSGKTTILFDQMSGLDGFVFQAEPVVGREAGVEHMTLLCRGAHGRYAISTPVDSGLYFTYRTRYFFRGLEFRGDQMQGIDTGFVYDYGWETYIWLADCWGAYIENIDAVGVYVTSMDPLLQPDHTFLRLSAAGAVLTARINGITTHGIKRGIEIGDRAFFFISHVDVAHSYEGLISTGTNIFSEGRIHDSLFNAQRVAVHLNNRSWTAIDNVAVSRHKSGFDHGQDWYGMKLEKVNKSWISNIRVQADTSVTKFSGKLYGFHFQNSGGINCEGVTPGLGLSYGIYLDNCPQIVFAGTNFQGVSGIGMSFQNNTRDIIVGPHVFSNGWTKYEYGAVDKGRIQLLQKDLQLEARQPFMVMRESDGAADQKNWKFTVDKGTFSRQIQNDADGGAVDFETVTRSSMAVSRMEWRADEFALNGPTVQTKQIVPIDDNRYSLGSMTSRWNTIYAGSPTIVTSDARDKVNVRDSELGLPFINALRPVSYRLKNESASGSNQTHYGLIAQEVRETIAGLGVEDFAGWIEDSGSKKQGLRYEEFISPLIKAVQELSGQVIELNRELAALKARNGETE